MCIHSCNFSTLWNVNLTLYSLLLLREQNSALHCIALQYSAHYIALHYIALQCTASLITVHCIALQCSALQRYAVQKSALQYSVVQHSSVLTLILIDP